MSTRVQVLFASTEGQLPGDRTLPAGGRALLSTAARTGGNVEKVVPLNQFGVRALLVLGDLDNPGRLGDLALGLGESMLDLGDGDELVMLQDQVETLGLTPAIGITGDRGAKLVASPTALYNIFQTR